MMHKLLMVVVILFWPVIGQSQSTGNHYDARNRYIGRTDCNGDTCREYDASNRYIGRSERRNSGDVYYYDSSNRLIRVDRSR